MSVPAASLRPRNLRLSVQRHLRATWSSPHGITVGWSEASFDPDALAGDADPLASWAAVTWLGDTSSAGGGALLQIDLCSRRSADELGDLPVRMAAFLFEALRRRSLPIYDFAAVDEATDAEVLIRGNRILVQNEAGRLGARSDMLGPVQEKEVWRAVVTYRFRLLSDSSTAQLT